MPKITALLLIVGSLLFLIAAFMPISFKVFGERDAQKRVEYIQNDRTNWVISSVLFGAGSVVAVMGLGLFARQAQNQSKDSGVRLASSVAAGAAALGAALWLIVVYNRLALPPEALASYLNTSDWMFPAYTLLTQLALILVGFVLIRTDYPRWLGWGMLVLGAVSLVAFVIFKDMPPFTHYLLLLVMGVVLLRQ